MWKLNNSFLKKIKFMFHFINEETNMLREVKNLLNVAQFINDEARDHTLCSLSVSERENHKGNYVIF